MNRNFILETFEIFLSLGKLSLLLADLGAPPSKIEEVVRHVQTHSAKVVDQERHPVLIAVPGKGCDVGDELGPRRAHTCAGLPHGLFGRPDLRIFSPGHPQALVLGGKNHVCLYSRVQFQLRSKRKSEYVGKLCIQVRDLQLHRQQALLRLQQPGSTADLRDSER